MQAGNSCNNKESCSSLVTRVAVQFRHFGWIRNRISKKAHNPESHIQKSRIQILIRFILTVRSRSGLFSIRICNPAVMTLKLSVLSKRGKNVKLNSDVYNLVKKSTTKLCLRQAPLGIQRNILKRR